MIPGSANSLLLTSSGDDAYQIERSLRFNSGDSSYLSRTFTSAGNRQQWTISFWFKLSETTGYQYFINANPSTYPFCILQMDNSASTIAFYDYSSSGYGFLLSPRVQFRDPSAWQHFVIALDTTQATASDRVKWYHNGELQALDRSGYTTYPSLNYITNINQAVAHQFSDPSYGLNSYMADVHFIDGQQLAATDFGEFDSNNVWQAKKFAGSYAAATGTTTSLSQTGWNPSTTAAGTHTNIWDGDTTNKAYGYAGGTIGAVTFNPPLTNVTKVECYTQNYNHFLNGSSISTPETVNGGWHTYYDNSGSPITLFSVGNAYSNNIQTVDLYAIRINGSIIDAQTWTPPSGVGLQSIGANSFHLDFADNSSNSTIGTDTSGQGNNFTGYNFGFNNDINGDSLTDTPTNYGADTGAGGEVRGNYNTLNPLHHLSSATIENGNLRTTAGDVAFSTFLLTSGKWFVEHTVNSSGYNLCFSQPDHPSGNTPSSTNSKTIGWYGPNGYVYWGAGSSASLGGTTMTGIDGSGYMQNYAAGDYVGAAIDMDNTTITFFKNGSQVGSINFGTGTAPRFTKGMIVSQFSGYGYWNFGQRSWDYPSSVPSGCKAICTQNLPDPLVEDGSKYFDTKTFTANNGTQTISGFNFSPDLVWTKSIANAYEHQLWDQVRGDNKALMSNQAGAEANLTNSLTFTSDGFTSGTNNNANYGSGGSVAWAWDAGSSNTSIAAGGLNSSLYNQSAVWSAMCSPAPSINSYVQGFDGNTTTTFAGGVSAGAYFTFTPTGGLSFTDNIRVRNGGVSGASYKYNGGSDTTLPANSWTTVASGGGTMTSLAVTRSSTDVHGWYAIEVDGKILCDSNVTPPTVPTVATTVRANPSAGFSIATYTGDGSASASIAHGLNAAPEMFIVKSRSDAYDWFVYHHALGNGTLTRLNTYGTSGSTGYWANKTPTSNEIFLDGNVNTEVAGSGKTFVCYSFTGVEGYSKFGSYTGNGSADGPFVYTGFRPAFILFKNSQGSNSWCISDTKRGSFNDIDYFLFPDANLAEYTDSTYSHDILSNGFKIRGTYGGINGSSNEIIFAAFAENPFKSARGR